MNPTPFLPHAILPFDEIELERFRYEARYRLDQRELDTIRSIGELSEFRDEMRHELVMCLRATVFGKNHPERHVIRYPSTCWDAVKERFAPAWFRDRYPVKFTVVVASLTETFPDFRPAIPDHDPVVRIAVRRQTEQPVW